MKIIRMYFGDRPNEVIATGLTREEAQAHCSDPETSSSTATSPEAVARTEKNGPWFDGFEQEDEDRDLIEEEKQDLVLREAVAAVNRLIG